MPNSLVLVAARWVTHGEKRIAVVIRPRRRCSEA